VTKPGKFFYTTTDEMRSGKGKRLRLARESDCDPILRDAMDAIDEGREALALGYLKEAAFIRHMARGNKAAGYTDRGRPIDADLKDHRHGEAVAFVVRKSKVNGGSLYKLADTAIDAGLAGRMATGADARKSAKQSIVNKAEVLLGRRRRRQY
jgi:hypothetical protein